ncbi:MAG: HIT family protein [Alphaproteobacteria bacterium]|nr:HIT family protein [Alphaproteobacteria bacterium]
MTDLHLNEDCIFCKIIRGEIPSFKLYEDDLTYAFMDINPLNDGHALVIPKYHAENIYATPDEWFGPTMSTVRRIASAVNKVVRPEGINLLQANGPGAKQSVFHLHMHVIPRYADDGAGMNWEMKHGDMDAIGELAEQIVATIE